MRRSQFAILAAAVGLAVGGCTESSTLPQEDDLTEFEAAQLATFLIDRSFNATGVGTGAQSAADPGIGTLPVALARVGFNESHTLLGECPVAGSLEVVQTVNGFADDETGEYEINAEQTQVYAECTATNEAGDFIFVLNSAPDVVANLSIAQDIDRNLTGSGAVLGAVEWTADNRFGRCDIDFEFSLSGEPGRASFSASGSICGVQFSQNASVTT
jgi:hypothetical protein